MVAGEFPRVERTEVDGIPVFWSDGPGQYTGALIFRVGKADESLRTLGLSHLVEHLAIFPIGPRQHPHNGFVDDTRTVFHAQGTPDEVASYLSEVCENLSNLNTGRLADERRILRAEEGSSPSLHPLWALRFGARTYGLSGHREWGLHWLEEDAVRAWAADRFTRENAALWFSGEPPADLRLELPNGSRKPPPKPESVPGLELPSWSVTPKDEVSMSMLVRRCTPSSSIVPFFAERLKEHLRMELGLSYSTGGDYWRLDAETAQVLVAADSAPGRGRAVRDGFLSVLDDLAENGPRPDELERYVAMSDRYLRMPEGVPSALDATASNELAGMPTQSAEALAKERADLTPELVAGEIRDALDGAIFLVPQGLGVDRATPYRVQEPRPDVQGRRWGPEVPQQEQETTIIGPEGVTYRTARQATTIHYDECALIAIDGGDWLVLISENGEEIALQCVGESGSEVLDTLVNHVGPDAVISASPEILERKSSVNRIADDKLGNHAGWAFAVLPRLLFDGEELLNLAWGTAFEKRGVLAVTDVRVLFLHDDRLLLEMARERITSTEPRRGFRKATLTLRSADDDVVVSGIKPAERVNEIAEALQAQPAPA